MSILKAFNNHLLEFTNDMLTIFPDDNDLKTTKIFLQGIIKIKPSAVIKIWKLYIVTPYEKEINNNDFEFFVNKNYMREINNIYDNDSDSNTNEMIKTVENFRQMIRKMSDNNKNKSMKYVQNLTKICKIYFIK